MISAVFAALFFHNPQLFIDEFFGKSVRFQQQKRLRVFIGQFHTEFFTAFVEACPVHELDCSGNNFSFLDNIWNGTDGFWN